MKNFIIVFTILFATQVRASIPNSDGTVSVCYSTLTGIMHAVSAGTSCGLLAAPLTLQASGILAPVRTLKFLVTSEVIPDRWADDAHEYSDYTGTLPVFPASFSLASNEYAVISSAATFDFSGCTDGSPSPNSYGNVQIYFDSDGTGEDGWDFFTQVTATGNKSILVTG